MALVTRPLKSDGLQIVLYSLEFVGLIKINCDGKEAISVAMIANF